MIQDQKKELLEIVNRALSLGDVTLSSGQKSNYYIDARLVTLSSKGAYLTASLMLDLLEGEKLDAIGGPTLGADPIIGAIAALSWQRENPKDTFIVRKGAKAYGKKKEIEGPLHKNFRVVLVDDVVTTGGSLFNAIETVEKLGCEVVKVLALVDRSEDAPRKFEAKGYKFQALFTSKDLDLVLAGRA